MSLRIYSYKLRIAGTEYPVNIKAKKDEAHKIVNYFHQLTHIHAYQKTITGIKGGPEHTTDGFILCGGNFPPREPDQFATKVENLMVALPDPITINDATGIREEIKTIYDAHVFISDKRQTPDEHGAQQAKMDAMLTKREEEARIREDENRRKIATLKKQYSYLRTTTERNNVSRYALGAQNLKTELSHIFPRQKFSVTSEGFSMGSAITVSWIDGPTKEEVRKISDKYGYGTFDPMTDREGYKNKNFTGLFGGAKYIHASRKISADRLIEVAAGLGHNNIEIGKWDTITGVSKEVVELIRRTAAKQSFPIPGSSRDVYRDDDLPTETRRGITVKLNREKNGVEIYFDAKPPEEIRTQLKQNRFRWSRRNRCWYHKQTPEAIELANAMAAD